MAGRIKDLIKNARGQKVAPAPMEEAIKNELPCISNAILIGERRKFIGCFLTFKVMVDKDNNDMPSNNLAPASIEWCRSVGSNAGTVTDILHHKDKEVLTAIQTGIDRANTHAASRAASVRKWEILPKDISMQTGEIGPTLKLKRFFFNRKYADAIERLYN